MYINPLAGLLTFWNNFASYAFSLFGYRLLCPLPLAAPRRPGVTIPPTGAFGEPLTN